MPCPLCDDTGWKPVEDRRRPPRRALRLLARAGRAAAARRRQHSQALSALHARQLHAPTTSRSSEAVAQARRVADGVSGRPIGAAARGQPGVGKTHLAVAVLKQVIDRRRRARSVLRHARSAARHPQHLRPVDPHDRARVLRPVMTADLLVLDDLGAEKTVGVGRGDDEPDRQHPLQRAAADDVHVELCRTSPTTPIRTRCCSGSASGCARGCTRCASSSRSTAPTIARLPANGGVDDLLTLWKMRKKTLPTARRPPGARAAARSPLSRRPRRPQMARRAGGLMIW